MAEFKVGDKIRIIKTDLIEWKNLTGVIGTIISDKIRLGYDFAIQFDKPHSPFSHDCLDIPFAQRPPQGQRLGYYVTKKVIEKVPSTVIVKGGKYRAKTDQSPNLNAYHECVEILSDGSAILRFHTASKTHSTKVLMIPESHFDDWVEWTEPKPEPVVHKAYLHWLEYETAPIRVQCVSSSKKRETGWSGKLLKIEEVSYTEGESK